MQRGSSVIIELSLSVTLCMPAVSSGRDSPREAVAVVSALSGTASVLVPSEPAKREVNLFDWLPAGSLIAVTRGSRLVLAYADGGRYEMAGASRATLSPERPKAESGTVRVLEPVPPIPRFASISASSEPGARSGAIRMRGKRPERIGRLYPRAESSSLPDSTVLRFLPVPGVARYRVVVRDVAGNTVFKTDTESPKVPVPAGVLAAGTHYYWEVWSAEATGPAARGESEFVTLSAEEVQQRTAFKARMEARGDAESLALLAEVDRRLGLLLEASDEFRAALAKAPSNATIRRILEELEATLSSP